MKVRIQHGSSSIELEGDKEEISDILSNWWKPVPSPDFTADVDSGVDEKPQPKRRTTKRPAQRPAVSSKEGASKINAEDVANRIKEHERFDLFNSAFILSDAARSDRARFVSWIVGETPITSGDVARVMTALGVKFDAATASRAMSDASRDWIKDSTGPQTTFRLSAPARHAFEQKLLNAKAKA